MIAFLAGEDNPKQWLHMDDEEMDRIISTIKDQNLRLTLAFGIGIHHAGLVERDRKRVHEETRWLQLEQYILANICKFVEFPPQQRTACGG